jgi:alpha(1,3/1,4) fucosyltransferase
MIYGNIYCEDFSANTLFDYSNPRNSDGLFTPLIVFREKLLHFGIEVNTPDINVNRKVSLEIHIDGRHLAKNNLPKYLIAGESPLINTLNADSNYLDNFRLIFSWNEATLNHSGALKILIPNNISFSDFRGFADRTIFSCLISSNKVTPWGGVNDLYAERISVVRWYESNSPDLFHLYGRGWGKPSQAFTRRDKFFRRIGRLRSQLFGYKPFPIWRGEVKLKSDILSNTKFSYCYENVKGLPNYITEKIFDSFLSGCVPIYWGADNVEEYIPPNCFVDRRLYRNTAEVHRYLMSITPEEFGQFQRHITDFLMSEKAYLFSVENFAKTIANTIASDIAQNNSW